MQVTRAADYAVRVMIHMASLPAGARAGRSDLARAAGCPEQLLSKVLQSLARARLIVSHRGNTGGFELPPNGTEATVLSVVEAIEGPLRLNACLANDRSCDRQRWCPANAVWAEAQRAMAAVLQSASIRELARQTAPPPETL
jgi:Rrf2 family protein